MTQNHPDPKEGSTLHMSVPKLVGIIAVVAAIAVAATILLYPKQETTVNQTPASQQSTSTQTEMTTVPDVVGLERQHAEKAISNAHLDVGKKTEDYSDTVPAGNVISQNPAAGTTAKAESKVDLVVSKGCETPDNTTMPDLYGKSQEEAEKAIADAKLVAVQGPSVVTNKVDPGLVCDQSIKAGATVKQGTHVSYSIALAPDTSVKVPNVAGESIDDARQQLSDAGLGSDTAYAYSDTVARDTIISQSIAADTKVAKGTVVTLSVSMGAKPSGDVQVPDVVGQNKDDATKALQDAGLTPDTTNDYSDTVDAGNVISQSIASGTKVAKGTTITIVVSMGPRPDGSITVPDETGKTADDAEADLTNLGLSSDRDETYSDTVPEGNVIGQSIPAGTKVAKDTVVTLTVSMGVKPTPPGPKPVKVEVPDIMTYTKDDAINAIQSAGLVERWSGEENGTVVWQDPPAGTEVDQGSTVTFTLEHISSKATVPDVSGMTAADADQQLSQVKLHLDYNPAQADQVLKATDPAAGALLDEDSHVQPVWQDTPAPQPQPDTTTDTDNSATDTTDSSTTNNATLQNALSTAGTNYSIVKVLSTQASGDGTNYTLLCSDDTGNYNVVIHIPGDDSNNASIVSATPAQN